LYVYKKKDKYARHSFVLAIGAARPLIVSLHYSPMTVPFTIPSLIYLPPQERVEVEVGGRRDVWGCGGGVIERGVERRRWRGEVSWWWCR